MSAAPAASESATPDFVDVFVQEMRERASDRRSEGADAQAQLYTRVADELAARYREYVMEVLSVDVAARESGYSEAQLYRIRRKLGHALRRCDLPRRPNAPPVAAQQVKSTIGIDLTDRVLQARLSRGRQ